MLEIPNFFKYQIENLSTRWTRTELTLLIQGLDNLTFEFEWLDFNCDEYVNSLKELDRRLLAKFMLDQLIKKMETE